MPESQDPAAEFTDIQDLPHEPIMRASGSPVSGRLVLLVSALIVIVIAAAAVFAVSQGVFAHPVSSY